MKKILLFITLISFTITQSQIVDIPDVNFKNTLLSASPTVHIAKDISGNWITIDINNDNEIQNSEAENIQKLYLYGKNITSLNGISAFNILEFLNCSGNEISNLDLSSNISLIDLYCYSTNLTTLDLSSNINLTHIYCFSIPNLEYINFQNGNNQNYIQGGDDFQDLPNLQSVCVDDITSDLVTFIDSFSDHSITYSEDCNSLSVSKNIILLFSVYPTPTENILNIKLETKIEKIEIYNKLGKLILKNETKNNINISNLTNGLYFVKVEDINGNFGVKKIIKK